MLSECHRLLFQLSSCLLFFPFALFRPRALVVTDDRRRLIDNANGSPPSLHDPDGTQPATGYTLLTSPDPEIETLELSYADLGAAMCEVASRRSEFVGQEVGVFRTGEICRKSLIFSSSSSSALSLLL
jgi:hypothetical protein